MNKYKDFKTIDFVNDPFFRDWVFNRKPESASFWNMLSETYPALTPEMDLAKSFLLNIADEQPVVADDYVDQFAERILRKHQKRSGNAVKPARFWQTYPVATLSAAASVLFVLGSFWFYFTSHQRTPGLSGTVADTQSGMIKRFNESPEAETVRLSDGSKVTLQPNSSLTYPAAFDGNIRVVTLDGEAFFDVVKNPDKPFLVHFNKLVVKVLGTSFTIRSFDSEEKLLVTVKTGKVSVFDHEELTKTRKESNPSLKGIVLTANQEIYYKKDEKQFEKSLIANPVIVDHSMKEEDFVFEETPLSEVFKKFERAYGIPIIVDENQIRNCTLTAFMADEPLTEKLTMMCKAIHASYEMIDGQIVMNVRSCKR
nr:FecR domain-containing protein [uncultured Dyadobacter sp.]